MRAKGLRTHQFPTLSQASDIVFWKRTADLMPSSINEMLSWLLPSAGVEAGLIQKQTD